MLRYSPPGSLVEITCRTIQGRCLLAPRPEVCELIVGVLARAARLYPIEIHAFCFLSNHFHLLATVPHAQRLAEFMCYLNSNLAREIGRRVGWRERFWGRRYQATLVSEEEPAQVDRLRYILSQGCKENLVRRPRDWPGANSVGALLTGEEIVGTWVDRTAGYEKGRAGRPSEGGLVDRTERLSLAHLPCWRGLASEVRRRRVAELVDAIELETNDRLRRAGRNPVGRQRLIAQHPHAPVPRPARGPAPQAHAQSARARAELREAYRAFVAAFRVASRRLLNGDLDAASLFPSGSILPPGPFIQNARAG